METGASALQRRCPTRLESGRADGVEGLLGGQLLSRRNAARSLIPRAGEEYACCNCGHGQEAHAQGANRKLLALKGGFEAPGRTAVTELATAMPAVGFRSDASRAARSLHVYERRIGSARDKLDRQTQRCGNIVHSPSRACCFVGATSGGICPSLHQSRVHHRTGWNEPVRMAGREHPAVMPPFDEVKGGSRDGG